jgi:uncharacterized protein (DUF1684 family)
MPMLRHFVLAAALVASASMAAPAAKHTPTPAEAWKASLVEDNADWATAKHAILKINDAAYVHAGEFVSLVGDAKNPDSWKWAKGKKPGAVVVATFANGKPLVTKDGKPVADAMLAKGIDIVPGIDVAGMPAQMSPGETGLRIMVFNQQNKIAKAFKGVDYFPYDASYRVMAKFKADPKMTPRIFRTSRGLDKQFYHTGDASFTLRGKPVTLPLYAETNLAPKIDGMSSFFTDELTGKVAYRAGRYVDTEKFGKFPPASVTIDFNYAYNPNCARSPFYNCPFAIDHIPLAVNAGEKDPHAGH